jgi:hypothetical protein
VKLKGMLTANQWVLQTENKSVEQRVLWREKTLVESRALPKE